MRREKQGRRERLCVYASRVSLSVGFQKATLLRAFPGESKDEGKERELSGKKCTARRHCRLEQ